MYWNSAHVENIYPVGTIYDGLALMVTVCSYADRVSIGLTEQSLAELETAAG